MTTIWPWPICPANSIWRLCATCSSEYRLARGNLEFRGEKVEPAAITQTAVLTVEGERDDICSVGQTSAALELCSNAPRRQNYLQPGAGHYGVFSGRRWQQHIYPVVRDFIAAS